MRTVIKAVMAQLKSWVLLVLPGWHGHAASRVLGHRSCGQPLGGGSCGGGPPARGGHWAGGGPLYDGSRREPS